MRPEDLELIRETGETPVTLPGQIAYLFQRTLALQRVVSELAEFANAPTVQNVTKIVFEGAPCPCGDNDGMHCSLEGCPYPQPKPKAKMAPSLPPKPVDLPPGVLFSDADDQSRLFNKFGGPKVSCDDMRGLLTAVLSDKPGIVWVTAGLRTGKTTIALALTDILSISSPTALMVPFKVDVVPRLGEVIVGTSGLRKKPRRYVIIDELGVFAPSTEGDIVDLAALNVSSYKGGKVIVFSEHEPPASRNIIYATSL